MSLERGANHKYWLGVVYPENMIDNWKDEIYDLIPFPFAYCVHDLDKDDKSEHRKDHVHIIIAFNNTTTYKYALTMFSRLSAPGRKCVNKCEPAYNIRNSYDYLIHDTEAARRKHKFLYDKSCRIIGNNFDIGLYEQLSVEDKDRIFRELSDGIVTFELTNYRDFYIWVSTQFEDVHYMEIMRSHSAHFDRLLRGNYQSIVTSGLMKPGSNWTDNKPIACPHCGSVNVVKNGEKRGKKRYKCKDCSKFFTI